MPFFFIRARWARTLPRDGGRVAVGIAGLIGYM
jgi:hypothetical protein